MTIVDNGTTSEDCILVVLDVEGIDVIFITWFVEETVGVLVDELDRVEILLLDRECDVDDAIGRVLTAAMAWP